MQLGPSLRRAGVLLGAIVHEVRTERITFMAGSIAYHAFVSLLPLLLLLLAVVSALGDPGLERGLIDLTEAALTPGAGDALVSELQSTSAGVSIAGLLLLVWGTLRIFRGLDTAFSDIYESETRNTFIDQLRDGALVMGSFAVAILVAVVVESTVSFDGTIGWFLHRVLLLVGLSLAFLPMYYVFPDQEGMGVSEVLPGVGFVAVGLVVFESLFRYYLQYSSAAASSSLLSGILVFLTWLYFSGLVMLLGVAINAVLSNRSRDVSVRPLLGGVPKTKADRPDPMADGEFDREELLAAVRTLQTGLPEARTVTVSVDDERVSLPPPERIEVDFDTSRLPFVSDSVSIEFRWATD